MPFAPFTCWSVGVATDCSTVRASAPVYVAVVWIWGGAISGNCADGRGKIMMAPPIIGRVAGTWRTIGGALEERETIRYPGRPRRFRRPGRGPAPAHGGPAAALLRA